MLTHMSPTCCVRMVVLAASSLLSLVTASRADDLVLPISETGDVTSFPLVAAHQAATVCADPADFPVVHIAVTNFISDVGRVTGISPALATAAPVHGPAIFVGTLGHSALIDGLVAAGAVDVTRLRGQWESFLIATVPHPSPGVAVGLVIVGSDRRGTAYGVFALSEAIGVSPWYWWADVPAAVHANLYLAAGNYFQGPPAVKYRGIFINDEDWGIKPWAAQTFEPERRSIGPRTYARIFELLLRLRANYLWPAMHHTSRPFNDFPEDPIVADQFAIVMGSSHCEPMLRNNVGEWHHSANRWSYQTNAAEVRAYWEERVRANGRYENVYTLGMRGVHDDPLRATGTTAEKVQLMEQIIADQRTLLSRWVNPDLTQIPQAFVPYKEVLLLYRNGLRVPDDVTLVWVDDNHGYLRQLSSPAEQRRAGGSGVYYHVSYLGAPESYLWLCSTPPALIGEEMGKALDQQARTLWVLNVGDLKPAELDTDYFLRLARTGQVPTQPAFLRGWAAANFGPDQADAIASVLGKYYLLNGQVKPEHLLSAHFSFDPENDEAARRMADYLALMHQADAINDLLPAPQRDAYYELVLYPVRCSAWANVKILAAQRSQLLAARHDSAANAYADQAAQAYDHIEAETRYYNQQLAQGKWHGMMSDAPAGLKVTRRPELTRDSNAAPVIATPELRLPAVPDLASPLMERHGCVAVEAAHFSRNISSPVGAWQVVAGLGRSGQALTVIPSTIESISNLVELVARSPRLEYDFTLTNAGLAQISVDCVPVHPVYAGRGARYAVGVDGEMPQIVDLETAEYSKEWATNVLRAAAVGVTTHTLTAGGHTLKLWMVDAGVPVDKIVIDLGGAGQSYFGPPETRLAYKR